MFPYTPESQTVLKDLNVWCSGVYGLDPFSWRSTPIELGWGIIGSVHSAVKRFFRDFLKPYVKADWTYILTHNSEVSKPPYSFYRNWENLLDMKACKVPVAHIKLSTKVPTPTNIKKVHVPPEPNQRSAKPMSPVKSLILGLYTKIRSPITIPMKPWRYCINESSLSDVRV